MNVNINGITWNVLLTNDYNNLMRSDGSITLGVTDINEKTIYLYDKLKGYMFKKVLIHELTHAFIFSYNFYISLEEEEFICSFVDTYAENIISDANEIIKKGFIELLKYS